MSIKRRKIIKILLIISLVIINAIVIIILIIFIRKKMNNDDFIIDEKESINIRLKNWEFGSTEEINLSGENITLGKTSDNFYKAPEDFYVCTAMGGLSGHSNKYFYEKELQNVDKSQFDCDWWFKTNFTLNNINLNENLILLHINGINYKSDIYLDGKLIEKKENIIGTFVKYTLDITPFLSNNENNHYIAFKIKRPYNQWGGKVYSNQTDLAISFVDWNPEPPDSNMGIWQPVDVEIIQYKISTISSAFIITKLIDDKKSKIEIVFHIKNWENKKINNNITIQIGNFINYTLENIILEPYEEKLIDIDDNESTKLIIDNSEL